MMAADPTGAEPPEERMQKLLKAKYDAGMLRPFNYVNGYARLNKYMEKNMSMPTIPPVFALSKKACTKYA